VSRPDRKAGAGGKAASASAGGATAGRADLGATHLALVVSNLGRSVAFYERYAGMKVVHEREESGGARVAWISDLTRPWVLVLIQGEVDARLGGFCHLGVGCASRDEGCLSLGPIDSGGPVGYWAFLRDPDGHNLELSFGQEVGLTVAHARDGEG
jgi:hypothetical protein